MEYGEKCIFSGDYFRKMIISFYKLFFLKVNGAYCNFMPAVIIVAINTQYELANIRSLFFLNGSLK